MARAAAIALGKRGGPYGPTEEQALIEAELLTSLDRALAAPALAEARALVTALGRVGTARAAERIRRLSTG